MYIYLLIFFCVHLFIYSNPQVSSLLFIKPIHIRAFHFPSLLDKANVLCVLGWFFAHHGCNVWLNELLNPFWQLKPIWSFSADLSLTRHFRQHNCYSLSLYCLHKMVQKKSAVYKHLMRSASTQNSPYGTNNHTTVKMDGITFPPHLMLDINIHLYLHNFMHCAAATSDSLSRCTGAPIKVHIQYT